MADQGGTVTILRNADATPVEMLPGIIRRTLADGESLMICEFTFDTGVEVPNHSHPHEQVGYVVSGRLRMVINGEASELGPGDSYRAPSNMPHSAVALDSSVLVDAFSPPRDDYR
jgi:quercetin dioxygenase-like cupin family protein